MDSGLVDKVAWIGDAFVEGPVKGLVLRFQGLGGNTSMKRDPDSYELEWSAAGGLIIAPYHNPWAWMSGDTVNFVDDVVDGVLATRGLAPGLPIIATGGSMGGHGSLTWTLKTRHAVSRCLALYPVCDLPYHYTERPDLPRTMHSAFRSYGDITALLEEYSPLHQAESMPDIDYLLVQGEKDKAVAKAQHSDRFVARLRELGRRVTYVERPNLEHGGPLDYTAYRAMIDFVKDGL